MDKMLGSGRNVDVSFRAQPIVRCTTECSGNGQAPGARDKWEGGARLLSSILHNASRSKRAPGGNASGCEGMGVEKSTFASLPTLSQM